jgi:hypothetical protein
LFRLLKSRLLPSPVLIILLPNILSMLWVFCVFCWMFRVL